ncbi:putative Bromodomain testis-specific protein [Xylaria sp. CBS 124048]|nr:putative Bromodomain testis-specific protein [Xylaria sp. CBS 124048]
MATEANGNGHNGHNDRNKSAEFTWADPHPIFCVVIVGGGDDGAPAQTFGMQKDFLVTKCRYFKDYFAVKDEERRVRKEKTSEDEAEPVENVVVLPNINPAAFALTQLFMYTGSLAASPKTLGFDILVKVWKLADDMGVEGLCEEALNALSACRAATNSIPPTNLLVQAWTESHEGSSLRALLLTWTAEYIRSSESRSEFTKSLPQEVLSELVVAMTNRDATPARLNESASPGPLVGASSAPPVGASSAPQKNVHHMDHGAEERPSKAIKHRSSEGAQGAQHRTKKGAGPARTSLPATPKVHKAKRSGGNNGDENQFSANDKLTFCADLLNRMLSGPGFWTRLVGPFKEAVRPVEDGVPDYLEKIHNPMDLGTIKKKMDRAEYQTAEEFEQDVKQIFENCYIYWGREHEMSAAAERFQKSFEEKFGEMFKWLAKNTDEPEAF